MAAPVRFHDEGAGVFMVKLICCVVKAIQSCRARAVLASCAGWKEWRPIGGGEVFGRLLPWCVWCWPWRPRVPSCP